MPWLQHWLVDAQPSLGEAEEGTRRQLLGGVRSSGGGGETPLGGAAEAAGGVVTGGGVGARRAAEALSRIQLALADTRPGLDADCSAEAGEEAKRKLEGGVARNAGGR